MVLGKLPVPGRPTIWMIVGQGPIALAVGAAGGCLDIFTLLYPFSHLSPSLWETARYRLKYCLKGPLSPKQPTKQLNNVFSVYFVNYVVRRITNDRTFPSVFVISVDVGPKRPNRTLMDRTLFFFREPVVCGDVLSVTRITTIKAGAPLLVGIAKAVQ